MDLKILLDFELRMLMEENYLMKLILSERKDTLKWRSLGEFYTLID